ncbi:MAG: hypothetical protein ACLFQX_02425 [Candidatus Kapaibacterium sp.]
MLNADLYNDREVRFHFGHEIEYGFPATMHYLYSESYLDANTFESPTRIDVRSKTINFSEAMKFPRHSVSIISFPIKYLNEKPHYVEEKLYINNGELIWINNNKPEDAEIYNYTGAKINPERIVISEFEIRIAIENLATGPYFIRWKSSTKEGILKFIKY